MGLGDEQRVRVCDQREDIRPNPVTEKGLPSTRSAAAYEETAFFDSEGRLVFSATPRGVSIGTLIVASSVFAEFQRNYRREVLLSRAAAEAGLTSIRFHYRGTGNSRGEPGELSLDSMTGDIMAMVSSVPKHPTFVVGTRLGALAAATVRKRFDVPLVLWEPVLEGSRWIEEVTRAGLARDIAEAGVLTASAIRERWETGQPVFVLGETVPASLVDQVKGESLANRIQGLAPALLIQMGKEDRIRPGIRGAQVELAKRGIQTDILPVPGRQDWWINQGGDVFRPQERDNTTTTINEGVIDWIQRLTK